MQDNNKTNTKDTAPPGREEEVIKNTSESDQTKGGHMTSLPAKETGTNAETEGERRFKEGMANNNDTSS